MILGIVPSLKRTGWSVIEDGGIIEYGIISSLTEQPDGNRLSKILETINAVLTRYPVTEIIIKKPKNFPGKGNRNVHHFVEKLIDENQVIGVILSLAGKWLLATSIYFVDRLEFDGLILAKKWIKDGFDLDMENETAEATFLALKKEKVLLKAKLKKEKYA